MADSEEKKIEDVLTPFNLLSTAIRGISNLQEIALEVSKKATDIQKKVTMLCTIANIDENEVRKTLDEMFPTDEDVSAEEQEVEKPKE